jgi:hypothetical protein
VRGPAHSPQTLGLSPRWWRRRAWRAAPLVWLLQPAPHAPSGRGETLTSCGDVEENPGPAKHERGGSSDEEGTFSETHASAPGDPRHFCPFPGCGMAPGRGGFPGWKCATSMFHHVDSHHVASGGIPAQNWLRANKRWVCGHCLALHSDRTKTKVGQCFALKAGETPVPWLPSNTVNAPPPAASTPLKGCTPLTNPCPQAKILLSNILGAHRQLLRHVPKGAANVWGQALADAIKNFLSQKSWESLLAVMAFAKVTLALPKRGGKDKNEACKEVRKRVARFLNGEWLALWTEQEGSRVQPQRSTKRAKTMGDLPPNKRALDKGFINSLQGFLDDGAFSKAAKHLLSVGLHDSSDAEIRKALEGLHPKRAPVQPLPVVDQWDWDDTSDEQERHRLKLLRDVVLQFPLGSAGGPSGLRPQHVQDVVRGDAGTASTLLNAMAEFTKAALTDSLPKECSEFLCAARLIPLRKPGSKMAVRPIAVGEFLRRMVSKFAMRSQPVREAVDGLIPSQVGVQVEGACETTAMCLQNWVIAHAEEPWWAILQIDLANAFNSIDREALLAEVQKRAPKLLAWANFCYANHSNLFLQGCPLRSEQGVQQGDPLGPLFFCLVWQRIVEQMPELLALNVWYLDDGHLVGSPKDLRKAADIIATEGAKVGVHINQNKCRVWGPAADQLMGQDPTDLWSGFPREPWHPDSGLKVLGMPVTFPGSFKFAQKILTSAVDELEEACTVLLTLGDTQSQHLLLRFCLDACKLVHFLRGTDCTPAGLMEQIQRASGIIRKTWADIVGAPNLSESEWVQSTLPMRLTGMGIKDPVVVHPAARMASMLTFTRRATALDMPEECCERPEDWSEILCKLQAMLGHTAEPMLTWSHGFKDEDVVQDHLSQKWWTHRIHKARHHVLTQAVTLRDHARLALQKMPHTTAWMSVIPNVGLGQKMEGREYRYLVKWWLGRRLLEGENNVCPCCEAPMDPFGDHLVSCSFNQPVARHNALRDALADGLREHGIACIKEVAIGGARRPADIALPNLDRRGPTAVDLVVHHPLAPAAARGVADERQSLKRAEEAKREESEELCHGNGWLFAPMGWHTWGGVGPHAAALLSRVEHVIAGDLDGWPRRNLIAAFRRKLTFALMSFVAKQLRAAEDAIMQSPPVEPSPPFLPGPVFSATELQAWEQWSDDTLFCGPIKIRTRPAPINGAGSAIGRCRSVNAAPTIVQGANANHATSSNQI